MTRHFLGLLALLCLGLLACGGPGDEPRVQEHAGAPVVLISIDTLRSDRLPSYGYQGVETPALDAFRADAILFERAYAHYPMTFPSHTSIFTGQLPSENGIRDNAGYRLAPGYRPYLPTLLEEAGYATAATVSTFALRHEVGLDQGFDLYEDDMESEEAADLWGPERFGSRTLEAAESWLATLGSEPFFLFFHIYEPHLPFNPPEPFLSRWGNTYEGEIAAADAIVGELLADLKERGLYDESLIIVLSDHGEGLMDHDEESHGVLLYREALQVPLMVKLPHGDHAGSSVSSPAGLRDVLPTVTEVLGIETPEGVSGSSLLELLEADPPLREIYSETMYPRLHYGWSDLASIIEGPYHYIEGPDPELYDLEADPAETKNLLMEERATTGKLRQKLKPYRTTLQMPAEEDPETAAQLEALGYLASSKGFDDGDDLPDPKSQLALYVGEMDEAFGLFGQGKYEEAIPRFRALLEQHPRMTDVWEHLGTAYREIEAYEDALEAYGHAMELTRGSSQVTFLTGRVLVAMGRIDEARRHWELVAKSAPHLARELGLEIALAEGDLAGAWKILSAPGGDEASADLRRRVALALSAAGRLPEATSLLEKLMVEGENPSVMTAMALVRVESGRLDEASEILDRVLEVSSEAPLAWETRGLVALRKGRPDEARSFLAKALELEEKLPNSWNLLGVARFQSGDASGALDAWERAVSLDPGQLDALYNLGLTAARMGRSSQARRALERYLEVAPADRFGRELAQARDILSRMEGQG